MHTSGARILDMYMLLLDLTALVYPPEPAVANAIFQLLQITFKKFTILKKKSAAGIRSTHHYPPKGDSTF